jgi:hypothetical protein
MSGRTHAKHQLRSISKSGDGSIELLSCSYPGCVHTETRHYGIGQFRRRPPADPLATKGGK